MRWQADKGGKFKQLGLRHKNDGYLYVYSKHFIRCLNSFSVYWVHAEIARS